MSRVTLPRRLFNNTTISHNARIAIRRRYASSLEDNTVRKPVNSPPQTSRERIIRRIHRIVPTFLHSYTKKLVNAPATHITSFLVLHEITAIIPIVGLASLFHFSNWLPSTTSNWLWVSEGVGKFGHWFKKKGWLDKVEDGQGEGSKQGLWWDMGNERFKVILE